MAYHHKSRLALAAVLLALAPTAWAAIEDWVDCPSTWYVGMYDEAKSMIQCTTLKVPLDYKDLNGEQIDLWYVCLLGVGGAS